MTNLEQPTDQIEFSSPNYTEQWFDHMDRISDGSLTSHHSYARLAARIGKLSEALRAHPDDGVMVSSRLHKNEVERRFHLMGEFKIDGFTGAWSRVGVKATNQEGNDVVYYLYFEPGSINKKIEISHLFTLTKPDQPEVIELTSDLL